MFQLTVKEVMVDRLKVGDVAYYNGWLLKVTRVGENKRKGTSYEKFRRIGRLRLTKKLWEAPHGTAGE